MRIEEYIIKKFNEGYCIGYIVNELYRQFDANKDILCGNEVLLDFSISNKKRICRKYIEATILNYLSISKI